MAVSGIWASDSTGSMTAQVAALASWLHLASGCKSIVQMNLWPSVLAVSDRVERPPPRNKLERFVFHIVNRPEQSSAEQSRAEQQEAELLLVVVAKRG